MKIGIDILGGDFAPEAMLEGARLAAAEFPSTVRTVLIGDQQMIRQWCGSNDFDLTNVDIVHATDVIGMGEHPVKAFSSKPDSTIATGFRLMKEGNLDAFSSCGNSGAMLVGAMYTIKAIAGVIRPCITTALPKEEGGFNIVLDVGTNADCKPDVLYQFAILGKLYAQHVFGIKDPKVGLLNIGEEPEKGNLIAQSAHNLMKDSKDFHFVGNVEGRHLLGDVADIIVCEGFTGNVILKFAESFYSRLKHRGINDAYVDRFNYELYGGTPILGVNGNVMIGHGISSPLAVKNMLLQSKDLAEAKLPEKIKLAF
ncbi:MAG TPA: phosphate acyltransferase PlsX [Bacteroidia bacterium]|jgi:glycerol-3-phosphate acyltransferase PlsX|nr:phosphate acyltransferase PlsX [Bacteroidia bacterium]